MTSQQKQPVSDLGQKELHHQRLLLKRVHGPDQTCEEDVISQIQKFLEEKDVDRHQVTDEECLKLEMPLEIWSTMRQAGVDAT